MPGREKESGVRRILSGKLLPAASALLLLSVLPSVYPQPQNAADQRISGDE